MMNGFKELVRGDNCSSELIELNMPLGHLLQLWKNAPGVNEETGLGKEDLLEENEILQLTKLGYAATL